ncbi:MAG TPA: tetratricopeptide repeat protein, partial [Pyrinomonadaceae bacterium]|nr:tetratricopeptide repeat protein [Pyrinomonadaceae bacterium]
KHLARRVAIKFLSSTDHHYRARFIREARAVSALNHPNIATVHDYGETDAGQPFIVMEFVKGKPLNNLLEEGITMRRSVEIVSSIAEALAEAHEHGIVHRDVKPSNVVVNDRGQVKVLDFGLVKHLFEQSSGGVDLDADTLYSTQTRSDVIVGTPLYLSPEQAIGKEVDGRSDIFALGALLYECLTGQSAFSGSSVLEIGAQIIHVTPQPPSHINKNVPGELDRITMKALEKKVEARYQSAADLKNDLSLIVNSLSGNGLPVAAKGKATDGDKPPSALITSLRRERFSLGALIAVIIFTMLAVWLAYRFWPRSYYQPSVSALNWYQRGTDALRNGANYQASKALEQAIAIDPDYSLAHARLAQAWTELDSTDKAKDELLSADRSTLSPVDALYLDAVTATVRRDFDGAVKAYSNIVELSPDDPQVYVDLGYAFENSGNVDKALENYLKSIATNHGQYATAYLRAGIVYNRKQDTAKAAEFFDKAEQLYTAESNNEGVNEVRRQRGILFRDKGKYDEARAQFQQSLDAARALGNDAQQINALIELSSLSSTQGLISEAQATAQQAVGFAQEKHLEQLAAAGLLALGNSFQDRGDYADAEKYYKQSLEFSRISKGRRREAQGLLNLGGLYIQLLRVAEGLPLVQQALGFFEQGNYPRSVSLCLTQIGRAHRRLGDYGAALQALNRKLQIAQQSGNQPAIADCYVELGAVLFEQESLPEALKDYNKAHEIYQSLESRVSSAFSQANRVNILWRLGEYDQAKQAMNEISPTANGPTTELKQLVPAVQLVSAQVSLSQRNFSVARLESSKAISLAGDEYRDVAIDGMITLGLAKSLSGSRKEGVVLCQNAVKMANDSGDLALLSRAILAQAEAALESGDARSAGALALQAQQRFAQSSQWESEWRSWLVAARASQQLGDASKAESERAQGKNVLLQLQQKWGTEAFTRYLSRPDIQVYYKQLG